MRALRASGKTAHGRNCLPCSPSLTKAGRVTGFIVGGIGGRIHNQGHPAG
jgi:hypothetical protein